MAGPSDLFLLAAEWLEVCKAAVATTAGGAIDRSFVSPGAPAWDCCLVGDSMVTTEHGPIPIREVRPGMRVWAYEEGRLVLRTVVRSIPRGEQPVYRVRGRRRAVTGTADHPMLRLRPLRARTSTGRQQSWEAEWTPISELRSRDVLVSLDRLPEEGSQATLPDGTTLTPELAWLLGLWVGDGCFDQEDGICLFIHNGIRDRAADILRQTWGVRPRGNSERLEVKSRELCAVFAQVLERVRAPEKSVPKIVWGREPGVIRSFLDGYAAADGHVSQNGYRQYATASARLAAETRMLHLGLGDAVSNLAVQERTQPIIIRGRTVREALPLHRFSYYPGSRRSGTTILDYRGARRVLPDERLGVATVSAVEPVGVAETFDLEVEGAHNFIADGLVVHNCPQLTVHVGGPAEGDTAPLSPPLQPGHRTMQVGIVPVVPLTATVIRCVPSPDASGNPPGIVALEAAAQEIDEDIWAIWAHTRARFHDGSLFPSPSGSRELVFDPAFSEAPEGGCAGWQIPLRVAIGGYLPDPPT